MKTKTQLETVKRIYDGWSEGDWGTSQEALDDDVIFVVDDLTTGPSTYHGRMGLPATPGGS